MRFLFSSENSYATYIRWYDHYLDDLLLVLSAMQELAMKFAKYINENEMNLEFAHTCNRETIHFLDVNLTCDIKIGMTISPYNKPMATNATLLASSCHPHHITKNIPVGELIWVHRNSSNEAI